MSRGARTQTRWGRLAGVFSAHTDKDLHALMACMCVLFEDMRIELAGQTGADLGGLDECGKAARQLYFLRRSIATLHEFGAALEALDKLPSFQRVKSSFDPGALKHWVKAVTYFKKHDRYIARLRNNVGGHFGRPSAEVAIANLLPDAIGALEVTFSDTGAGAKLLFSNEIVATGTLRHVPGKDTKARARRLIRHAVVAYRKAAWAVDCLTSRYLWDRFGK